MCGIWAIFSKSSVFQRSSDEYYNAFDKIKSRGPDRSRYLEINTAFNPIKLGFHRLAIMDLSSKGDQPFVFDKIEENRTIYVLVNGEIYNYKKLMDEHNLILHSGSDCEVVAQLYIKYGFKKTINLLDGEWACIIIEIDNETRNVTSYIARDPFGVRPLFFYNNKNAIGFCSELKGLSDISAVVNPFPPTSYAELTFQSGRYNIEWNEYYKYNIKIDTSLSVDGIKNSICNLISDAVCKRLDSERPIGCLLSGGIDSSLVAALASQYLSKSGKKLRTFSTGLPDSPDVYFAQQVANHIGSIHTVVPFDPIQGLKIIPTVIKTIESYDITTVRASVPNFMLLEWISKNTDIKVILTGEYMDEVAGSYLYLHNAPNPKEFHKECVRLVKDIYMFDSLRADRCIAGNGIEARVPFSDQKFIEFYLSIDPSLRMPRSSSILGIENKIEKALVREAFFGTGLLPDSIITRTKNAFSDAISHETKSWYQYIEEYTEQMGMDIIPQEYNNPPSKEASWYRDIFEQCHGSKNERVVPYFWLPKWSGNVSNPSARVLDVYKSTINEQMV